MIREDADRFITENLDLVTFREKAISSAVNSCEFSEAERLCLEGEQKDARRWGLEKKWQALRYNVYQASGDKETQRRTGMELLIDGFFDYYDPVKALTNSDDRPSTCAFIIGKMEESPYATQTYLDLLKAENETEKMLSFCKRHPEDILEFYPYLISGYGEEVRQLFMKYIEARALDTGSRNFYRSICNDIRTFGKACGDKQAEELIDRLQLIYSRRPAFKEELEKLR